MNENQFHIFLEKLYFSSPFVHINRDWQIKFCLPDRNITLAEKQIKNFSKH